MDQDSDRHRTDLRAENGLKRTQGRLFLFLAAHGISRRFAAFLTSGFCLPDGLKSYPPFIERTGLKNRTLIPVLWASTRCHLFFFAVCSKLHYIYLRYVKIIKTGTGYRRPPVFCFERTFYQFYGGTSTFFINKFGTLQARLPLSLRSIGKGGIRAKAVPENAVCA